MEFTSLASSSRGNAYIVGDGKTKLLIECGVTFKQLERLTKHTLSEIDACLISHEHKDHSRCARELILSGMPVYTSYGTAEALGLWDANVAEEREMFSVGTLDVLPFGVFHDAAEPLGFLIRSRETGTRLLFATDTASINYEFAGLDIVAIECNYMHDVLERAVHLPDKVRYRIQNSHMEAGEALRYITTLDTSKLRRVYLMHLSDACSNEGRISEMFSSVLGGVHIEICGK